MKPDSDLFGNPIDPPPAPPQHPRRAVHNDMDLVERVLHIAQIDGYVLIGLQERVYRVTGTHHGVHEIEAIAIVESDVVHQLIDHGFLAVGGCHHYRDRNHRAIRGHTVVVPKGTRQQAARWRALARPSTT